MTEKRIKVEPVIDDKSIGAWSIRPNKCPAAVALKFLGQKPWTCASGIMTNAQGAVPLRQCKHKRGDVEESGGEAFVVCGMRTLTDATYVGGYASGDYSDALAALEKEADDGQD